MVLLKTQQHFGIGVLAQRSPKTGTKSSLYRILAVYQSMLENKVTATPCTWVLHVHDWSCAWLCLVVYVSSLECLSSSWWFGGLPLLTLTFVTYVSRSEFNTHKSTQRVKVRGSKPSNHQDELRHYKLLMYVWNTNTTSCTPCLRGALPEVALD